jgi:CHAT domain-containing protein/Tfp pilus assembly protein PilF
MLCGKKPRSLGHSATIKAARSREDNDVKKNIQGGIAVFSQVTPISSSQGRGLRTTRPVILTIILLAWIGLPVAAWPPPDSQTTQAGDSARGAAQSADEELSLEPRKPIERELSGGQSHFYKIAMTSGQYLRITVNQKGIDALVAMYSPDGKKVGEVDSKQATVGSETISAIAESAGAYRVEARSVEKTAKTGRYEIKVEELREATAEDKYRVAAESLFREAGRLKNGTLEEKRKGIEKYQEALELYRRAGASREEAETFKQIASVYYVLGDYKKMLEMLNMALPISQTIGARNLEAEMLGNIGTAYLALGDMQKGVDKYNECLAIFQAMGEHRNAATVLYGIGTVYFSSGDLQKAMEKLTEALPMVRAVGDRTLEAMTIGKIGTIYMLYGETQEALDKNREAMQIYRSLGNRSGEAEMLHEIGICYLNSGEMQKALDNYNEALTIKRAVGDRRQEAYILHNIGTIYISSGETQKALDRFNESLAITRAIGDRYNEVIPLNNIGDVYQSRGDLQKALEKHNEALLISRALGNRRGEAGALYHLGKVYNSLGERQKALEHFNESLSVGRAVGERLLEAATIDYIGLVYSSLGEDQKALEKFNKALSIWRVTGNRYSEAGTLLWIARSKQKQGALTQARQTIDQAIDIIESLRAGFRVQDLRTSYFASRQEYYETYVDILMEQHKQNPAAGFDAEAFAVSERARARSLLELLTESRIDVRQGIDSSLLERERSLQQLLNAKAAAQFALLNRKHTPAQAEAAAKEIASITTEYDELRAQIRARSPRYAALTQPEPLSLAEIQLQVLDPNTLLLEYSLGDNASYLFVVSQTSITSYRLPNRAEVETATRRVRELLTAPQPQPGDTEAKYQARINESRASYWPQAAALSRMLLGPAAPQLGRKRLLIVADGALQYLPFGALPAPETEGPGDSEMWRRGDVETSGKEKPRPVAPSPRRPLVFTPLIVNHEIVHLPSASALAGLRRELAGRKPAAKTVAVLADPVFSADDARVKSGASAQAGVEAPPDLTLAINDVRGELRRLLMTRDEAEAIFSVTRQTDRFGALDFRANRATAVSDELSRYRIVHFATHGLLNTEHPELSGVVLSLVDERGKPQDGFLRLHEIFNLRLPAELVVLSACQTGLGKEVKGEGLVGLTRGFMYAGAARVVASLWQVNDAATAELMKRFYRRMLQDGVRPAAALRAAQIDMWRRPQWRSPFYWAGFALQGEWK